MTKEEITYQCTRDIIQKLIEEKVNSLVDDINSNEFKERVINELYQDCHIEEEHDFTIEEALEGFVPLFNSAKSSFIFHLTNVFISKIRIK
jgi:hypothetical protein